MSDIVTRARELLAGIAPGRWSIQTNRHPECSGRSWGWIEGPRAHYCWSDDKPGTRADAEFIAAAPQLVAELANEVERLRERQESHDLANKAIEWKGRALDAEAKVAARTIETVEQLDALPEQSVVRNEAFGVVFEKGIENDGTEFWESAGLGKKLTVMLPARLLWHPEVDA